MRKLYWLFNNYRITGAIFKVAVGAGIAPETERVDTAARAP